MTRDLARLAHDVYDVLVVGGGMYGACAAYEAALRGLSVALVEKDDFGGATSANSLKIIHGGLRYLQQADFPRMRESIRERRALLRIAPHLVRPLPVVVPTYGHGLRGKALASIALALNDLMSLDRNRLDDPGQHISRGRTLSRGECLQQFEGVDPRGLTGAIAFCDAQVYNSERLPLAFLCSAYEAGAALANYVEALDPLVRGGRIAGVHACDRLSGATFDIQAKTVINVAGPWADGLDARLRGEPSPRPSRLALGINLVTRQVFSTHAVGVWSRALSRTRAAEGDKAGRVLFIAPWRDFSLIGTAYTVCDQPPDAFHVPTAEIERFLGDVNRACPGARLDRGDIRFVHKGLLPMTGIHAATGDVCLTRHYHIQDERNGGYPGLITVVGVKYTTARDVAERTIDRVDTLRGVRRVASRSAERPLHGGDVPRFSEYLETQVRERPFGLGEATLEPLIRNYGTLYREVLNLVDGAAGLDGLPHDAVLLAQVRYAVRREMALKLVDVVFRRTDLGSGGHPGNETLRQCAAAMGAELGWNPDTLRRELSDVTATFEAHLAIGPHASDRAGRRADAP